MNFKKGMSIVLSAMLMLTSFPVNAFADSGSFNNADITISAKNGAVTVTGRTAGAGHGTSAVGVIILPSIFFKGATGDDGGFGSDTGAVFDAMGQTSDTLTAVSVQGFTSDGYCNYLGSDVPTDCDEQEGFHLIPDSAVLWGRTDGQIAGGANAFTINMNGNLKAAAGKKVYEYSAIIFDNQKANAIAVDFEVDANGSTPEALAFTGGTLNYTVGTAIPNNTKISGATGGLTPYTFAVDAATANPLPAGINLGADGTISGTPTKATADAGVAVTVKVTDAKGAEKTAVFTVKVAKGTQTAPAVTVANATLKGFDVTVANGAYYIIDTNSANPAEAAFDTATLSDGNKVTLTDKNADTTYYVHAMFKGDADKAASPVTTKSIKTLAPVQATIEAFAKTKDSYGATLPTVVVKAGGKTLAENTDYTVAWKDATGNAPAATPVVGTYTATVTITDTDAYKAPAPNTITFTIEKATPVLSGTLTQTPTDVTAGSTLADVTLTGTYKNPVNAGMTVAGNITWKNANTTVINGTTKSQGYTFTPDDTDNYNTVEGTHTINLAGLTNPVVTYGDLTHTYDGTKKAATVTWTTPAAGTLTEGTDYKVYYTGTGDTTYTKSDVAPTDAGTYTVSIEIIGNAANTYNNPAATDTLTINPKEIAKTDFDYSGLTVSKREDGTTNPGTVGGSVKFNNGVIIAGDNVTMKVTAGAYADATVGTDKTVTLTFALDGADKGNYVLAADAGTGEFNKAEITKKMSGSIGGGSSSSGSKYYDVTYKVGKGGTISGSDSESVKANAYPTKTPKVTAKDGYEFKGWSLDGKTIVDPSDVRIKEDTTFTAIFDNNKTADLNKDDHIAYVRGYEDGTFAPNKSITRAEAITIFARLMNEKMDVDASYNSSFSDVKAGAWYANYIGYMEDYNIINGYEDGTFRPDAAITRAEFAAMASRFDKLENTDKNAFTDVAASHWAINSINSAYAKGWIGGYPDGTFRPNQNISRAEVVSIVNNMLEREIDAASIAGAQYKTFPDVATNHWAYFDVIEAANEHDYTKDGNKETWK